MSSIRLGGAVLLAFGLVLAVTAQSHATVIELFEDDPGMVDQLANQDSPTDIQIESTDVYGGNAALMLSTADPAITNGQRYNATIPDWNYAIVESPAADTEARWVGFAWKKQGGSNGIMVQFPDDGGWGAVTDPFVDPPAPGTRRYIAGENLTGWTGIQVSPDAPADWGVVVRDLFGDFEGFVLTGIALTPFDGVGYYDSIYLGATEDEVRGALTNATTAVEPRGKLATTWSGLKSQ